jgi:hypothetical protein
LTQWPEATKGLAGWAPAAAGAASRLSASWLVLKNSF